jgi:hypothetical protein
MLRKTTQNLKTGGPSVKTGTWVLPNIKQESSPVHELTGMLQNGVLADTKKCWVDKTALN